jgi:hypothetical protein
MLPADLRTAELELLKALRAALAEGGRRRWTAELRFEGLRIMPVAIRLAEALRPQLPQLRLLFPDAGATALAKRDAPELVAAIASVGDLERLQQADGGTDGVVVIAAPTPADYDAVERTCGQHRGPVLLLNGRLEDAAVGIGTVARERRKGFLGEWQSAYALIPTADGALRHAYPDTWRFYRRDPDGYRFLTTFETKPDTEQQLLALEQAAAAAP